MRVLPIALILPTLLRAADACRLSPEAQSDLRQWQQNMEHLSMAENRKGLDSLVAKYPGAYDIQVRRLSFYGSMLRDERPATRAALVKRAEENSKDPMALTLAGAALHRYDTPRAIELLMKAREAGPNFPWSALKLAEIFQAGRYQDLEKARTFFRTYADLCGGSISNSADWVMSKVGTPADQAEIARRIRVRLETADSPQADDFEMLWAVEFRTRPPQEHAALRKQVAKDVERLLALKPERRTLGTILNGMKQSGASKEDLASFEDRVLKEAPTSHTAYAIAFDRWNRDHKEPDNHKDTAAWEAWRAARRTAMKEWTGRFAEVRWLADSYLKERIEASEISATEAVRAMDQSVSKSEARSSGDMWSYSNAATPLLQKGWAPAKTAGWLEKAWPYAEVLDRWNLEDDTLTDDRRQQLADQPGYRGYLGSELLRAFHAAGRKDIPASLRTYLDGAMPAKGSGHSSRYRALAWLAAVDGRSADSLAYFQQALFTREKAPQVFRGKLEDPLLDEARTAFLKAGGTEKAFAAWSRAPSGAQQLAEGRWEKPKKPLPAFELADLSGTTWKLKQLEGKAVLINLWATWCGPCRSELPHFQKLYENTKESSVVQVISFNVDEEFGLVEPYMKEHGFTFPVLAAFGLVRGMFDGYGIPQNWLVDPKGDWIATQIGFDASDTDWVSSMLKRLEDAKQGKAPAGTE